MRLRTWLLLLALFFVTPVFGQTGGGEAPATAETPAPVVPSGLASPRDTLRTFLDAMGAHPPDRETAIDCMVLDGIARDAAPDLATKLHRIFNRIEFVDLDDPTIPDESRIRRATDWTFFPPERQRLLAARGDTTQLNRYKRVQQLASSGRIVLERQPDGAWKFSAQTVAGIEPFWDAVGRRLDPVPGLADASLTIAERLESLWPDAMVTGRFLGVRYWQWVTLVVIVFAGLVLDLTMRLLLAAVARRWIRRRGGEPQTGTMRKTVRPFGLAVAAVFWLWAMSLLGLPSDALKVLGPCVRLFWMLAMVWAAFRVTDLVGEVLAQKAEATDTKFDDLVVPLVRKAVKILIVVFGLIYIANSFDVEIAPLLTGLGIGGVGFAFAAKDTLENLFGSVTVIVDRPFQVGDWVTIGDTEGTVEELGLRSVRIRTFYNSLSIIPTANLVRACVDNYGRRKYRRWKTHVNLSYGATPEQVEAFCEGVREMIRLHPYTRKDYYQVWLHQFGAHSIDVLVYMFFEVPDWSTELRERHRLMLDMMRLANQLGVEFAFPTQTLHVFQEDADAEHEVRPAPGAANDFRAMRAGRRAARTLTGQATWRERRPGAYRFTRGEDDADLDPGSGSDDSQVESKIGGDA